MRQGFSFDAYLPSRWNPGACYFNRSARNLPCNPWTEILPSEADERAQPRPQPVSRRWPTHPKRTVAVMITASAHRLGDSRAGFLRLFLLISGSMSRDEDIGPAVPARAEGGFQVHRGREC